MTIAVRRRSACLKAPIRYTTAILELADKVNLSDLKLCGYDSTLRMSRFSFGNSLVQDLSYILLISLKN